MSTKLKFSLDYPKSVDAVMHLFTDRNYFEQKYALMGCENIRVLDSRRVSGESFHIRVSMRQKASAPVPGFAQKFISEWQETTQRDSWNVHTGTGEIEIDVAGVPASITAEMSLYSTGPKSAKNDVVFQVSVKLPLVGAKLEKLIAEDIKAKAAKDHEATLQLLSQAPTA